MNHNIWAIFWVIISCIWLFTVLHDFTSGSVLKNIYNITQFMFGIIITFLYFKDSSAVAGVTVAYITFVLCSLGIYSVRKYNRLNKEKKEVPPKPVTKVPYKLDFTDDSETPI